MMSSSSQGLKTVLVTGSNKGIGYGILSGLLEKDNYKVILTSRNEKNAKSSYNELLSAHQNSSDKIFYHQLDITDSNSISSCVEWVKKEFEQIDVIVNNAAVYSGSEGYDYHFNTNFYGTINFTEKALQEDIIRDNGKIVIIGSLAGSLSYLSSQKLKNEFMDEKLTMDGLYSLAERYKKALSGKSSGWFFHIYAVSKMFIHTYTTILAKKKEVLERNISVYCCHPGWVKTNIGGSGAPMTIEEGVVTPLFLIQLKEGIDQELQGKYFDNCKVSSYFC